MNIPASVLIPLLLLVAAVAPAGAATIPLASFESDSDLKAIEVSQGVTIERSIEHATDGQYSLKLTISSNAPEKWLDIVLKPSIADFSPYDYLLMDVYRDAEPGATNENMLGTIQFADIHGNARPGWVPLLAAPRKAVTARTPVFLGIAQVSNKSKFSFTDVARIKITLDRPAKDYCIYIDNMRLTTAPPPETGQEVEIAPKTAPPSGFIPFRDRDLDFRVRASQFYVDNQLDVEKLRKLKSMGFDASKDFSLELLPLNLVTDQWQTPPYTWQNYEHDVRALHDTQMPFVVDAFNFWAGSERYEYLTARLRRIVRLATDLGGDYFVGLRLSESEAVAGYVRVQEQPTEPEKADAYAKFVRGLVKDAGLPKDKLLILDVSNGLPYEWAYAAGADIVGQAFLPILPIELCESALRGTSESYGKPWGWDVTRWPLGAGDGQVDMPFDPITGRPTKQLNKVDSLFFGNGGGGKADQSDDMYKIYVSAYYSGARYFNGFSENVNCSAGDAIRSLYRLAEACPRGETVVSSIAVMRGKGTRWAIPIMSSNEYPAEQTDSGEFMYLNTFFPGFSADGKNARCWWTGTPFGSVDTICPEMKLADMKRYNVILFLGYNRMDANRKGFINDLIAYAQAGGTIIMSADQMKNGSGDVDPRLQDLVNKGSIICVNKDQAAQDVILRACRKKPLAIDISPNPGGIQFCLSKTGSNEAVLFLMNHGKHPWTGDVTINLASAGLSSRISRIDKAIVGLGYETKPISPTLTKHNGEIVVKGIQLPGDSTGFCTYRKASFAYVRLKL